MSFCNLSSSKNYEDDEDLIIDDSISSDYYEGFRTNSSSSIKWSIDARKQNEEDWLQIERILYGEEPLPEDEKTKEELSCWMNAFPHLRIIGTKLELPPKKAVANDFFEEVIAIDPPRFESSSFRLLDQELNEKLSLKKSRLLSGKSHDLKNEHLDKLLRITSSGLVRNREHNYRPQNVRKLSVDKTSTLLIKNNDFVPSNGSIKKLTQIKERDVIDHDKHSYSASNSASRIGPLLNVKFLYKKPDIVETNVKSVKSATSKLPLYELISLDKSDITAKSASMHTKNPNIIQLPPFNFNDLDFPIVKGRSIQSAVSKTNVRTLKH
ncbi:hypothetical protein PVAND_002813 [Polypedilum vanderplanki]|uniref:Uncharacterized protein n=1 Tax=Polypedilum vanderplanki TaxID=319348 RepID=A0A9J6BSL7_POLVA|nr:hypothetical protein PVAND_002813 [Polypedilum vanderplanki]